MREKGRPPAFFLLGKAWVCIVMWKAYITLGFAFVFPYGYLGALGTALGLTFIPSKEAAPRSAPRSTVLVRAILLVPTAYLVLALFFGEAPAENSLTTILQCDFLQIPICYWALLFDPSQSWASGLRLALLGVSTALVAYSLVQIVVGRIQGGSREIHIFFVLSAVSYAFPFWVSESSGKRSAYAFLVQIMVVLFQAAVITGASTRIVRPDGSRTQSRN